MDDLAAAVLAWIVPAAIVFAVAAIGAFAIVWAVRRSRRSPRARAAADAARAQAGVALVRLDDAVEELDIEVGLSGALYGGDAPPGLRRARMTAQHIRDRAFTDYRVLSDPDRVPADVRLAAERITRRCTEAMTAVDSGRTEHAAWVATHLTAGQQVAAISRRLVEVRAAMGDPEPLLADLRGRFDEAEWRDAAAAATAADAALQSAGDALARAGDAAEDPTRSVRDDLAATERSLRAAEANARIFEETHRLVLQAAQNVMSEIDAARDAVRQATSVRADLEPRDAERLGEEVRAVTAALDDVAATAARRPTAAVDTIARLRGRLDLALGDARTAQQRLRGARTALPGTLAAARSALAHAEASALTGGVDARVRLAAAHRELAQARAASDPVEALDAARRARQLAEDAAALADYARLAGR